MTPSRDGRSFGLWGKPIALSVGLPIGLALGGCSSLPTLPEIAPKINATIKQSPQFLIAGDEIEVRFPRKPEWDQTSIVRRDGKASFHFLREFTVAGMTVRKLTEHLAATLRNRGVVEDPDLTVNLVNPAVRRIAIMGEVSKPGGIDIENGHLSLLEALGKAGGPRKGSAKLSEMMLIRWLPLQKKQQVWHFDARREHWRSGPPLILQAHDVIYIPNNAIDKVNVWVDKYIRQNLPLPISPVAG